MNFKKYQGGAVNKFNKDATNMHNGYLNDRFLLVDNTTSTSSLWAVSEYIDISGISTLSAKDANTTSTTTAICYYNDNKTFISGTSYNGTSKQTFTVPSNAKYCRISYIKSGNAMLVEGSTVPSEYHPYYEWNSIPYHKYGTSTDTLTTLPAVLYPNDTTATMGLKGQMEQSSTPSPTTPIQPQECGERTGNLFSSTWEQGSINGTTGQNEQSSARVRTAEYMEVSPNKIYSISRSVYSQFMNLRFYSADKSFIGAGSTSTIHLIVGHDEGNPMSNGDSFCCFEIIDTNIKYMRIGDQSNNLSTRYMMVEGEYTQQTMPAYEPYGYFIEIEVS